MKYEGIVFDLDGTLLDTLDDLRDSVNVALHKNGYEPRTREEIRSFVGNGIRNLISRSVPGGEENPDFSKVFEAFRAHYGEHCMDQTEPYPGILWMLDSLKKQGCKLSIVSNKADFAVKKLAKLYFEEILDAAIGEREGCARKPAPDAVFAALKEMGVSPKKAVYVGDSEVDLITAANAGLPCVMVSWGFRQREYLLENGATEALLADNARELFELLGGEDA